jgi:hypothetical protein
MKEQKELQQDHPGLRGEGASDAVRLSTRFFILFG